MNIVKKGKKIKNKKIKKKNRKSKNIFFAFEVF